MAAVDPRPHGEPRQAPRALTAMLMLLAVLVLACSGCGHSDKKEGGADGDTPPSAAPKTAPPSVVVEVVRREDIPTSRDFTAQTVASKTVNVSAQVSGQLMQFSFREGASVVAGQVLFQIDPAPYQAAVQQAEAQLMQAQAQAQQAQAQLMQNEADLRAALDQVNLKKALAELAQCRANLAKAQRDVDRYTPLARNQVIPQQKLDDAVSTRDVNLGQLRAQQAAVENTRVSTRAQIDVARANVESAQANVASARANVEAARAVVGTKQISLGYCTITSPVTGLISRLTVDPGNIVSPTLATPLATISKNDPMYVDFNVAEVDYIAVAGNVARYQASTAQADRVDSDAPFQLLLADGSTYNQRGRYYLAERSLDAKTGTLLIRATFPNPRGLLKPGQFGRIRLEGKKAKAAILVPQKAVTEIQSMQAVLLVDKDDKVVSRPVVTDGTYQESFIIKEGLKGGERVIVDGVQKVRPGQVCSPTSPPAPTPSPRR